MLEDYSRLFSQFFSSVNMLVFISILFLEMNRKLIFILGSRMKAGIFLEIRTWKKYTHCSARERARAHHLRVRWSEWQNVNLNIFHFFCVLEIVQLIQMTIFSSLSHQLKIKWQTLTSTIKRPAGSPSTAISKNTRGNAIFLLAKLRRHNWIKLDWLAKWFWFSVCRRLIERACRHSVPATREAIFLHVLRIDDVMVCAYVWVASANVWMRKV